MRTFERLLGRTVWVGGVIAFGALVFASRHDILRYLHMRRM